MRDMCHSIKAEGIFFVWRYLFEYEFGSEEESVKNQCFEGSVVFTGAKD